MVDRILRDFYGIEDRDIVFNGKKPFLKNRKKFFSVSHSNDFIALAFSDYDCGVDIEKIKIREFEDISKRMGFKCNTLESSTMSGQDLRLNTSLESLRKSLKNSILMSTL